MPMGKERNKVHLCVSLVTSTNSYMYILPLTASSNRQDRHWWTVNANRRAFASNYIKPWTLLQRDRKAEINVCRQTKGD